MSAIRYEPTAERSGLEHAGRGNAARLSGVALADARVCTDETKRTLPVGAGHGCSSTGAVACSSPLGGGRETYQPPQPYGTAAAADLRARTAAPSTEPSVLAVRRSARRLDLLGSRASASRLPGSARPMADGTRPADADDVSLASLAGCALVGVVTFLVFIWW